MYKLMTELLYRKLDEFTNNQITEEEKKILAEKLGTDMDSAKEYAHGLIEKYSSKNKTSAEELKQIAEDMYKKNDAVIVGVVNGGNCMIAAETNAKNLGKFAIGIVESLEKVANEEFKQEVKDRIMRILGGE